MGSCILMGFEGGGGYTKLFEMWATYNLLGTHTTVPSRGHTPIHTWCATNFISTKQTIPEPTGYTFDALKGWAKANFIMTKVDV